NTSEKIYCDSPPELSRIFGAGDPTPAPTRFSTKHRNHSHNEEDDREYQVDRRIIHEQCPFPRSLSPCSLAPYVFRAGLCIGTTCTVTSRTSDRNRFSTDPPHKMSQRERADCPNTTWLMFSCCANRISASETFRSVSVTTCAPRSRAIR